MALRPVPEPDKKEHRDVGNARWDRPAGMSAEVPGAPFPKFLHSPGQCQRIKHVIPHPGAQRDVPSAPEIPQGDRKVGLAEVLVQLHAKEGGDAPDDVNAPGKVGILPDGIQEDSEYHHAAGPVCHVPGIKDCSDRRIQHVGDGILLHQAEQHQKQCPFCPLPVECMRCIQGSGKAVIPSDRSLQHLGKPGDKKQEAGKIALRRILPAVLVDQIPHRLKRVERDPNGQKDALCMEQNTEVLKPGENAEIYCHHQDQDDPLLAQGCCLPSCSGSAVRCFLFLLPILQVQV